MCQERAQRAQILDLETQLNQTRAECLKAKHDKEEVSEKHFLVPNYVVAAIKNKGGYLCCSN